MLQLIKEINMTSFQSFRKFVKTNRANIIVKGTPTKWPYNYGTSIAYEVTFKGNTQYLYFNADGVLLVRELIK